VGDGVVVLLAAVVATGCMIDRTLGSEGTDEGSSSSSEDEDEVSGMSLDDTSSEPQCGNGVVEIGEGCDDLEPSLGCNEDCTVAVCGDMHINAAAGESCEGIDLAGGSCEGLGFAGGTLSCSNDCSYVTSDCSLGVPVLQLAFSQVKQFDFSWGAVGADYYQLLESASPGDPFVQLGEDIVGESVSVETALHFRLEASYLLRACSSEECTDSAEVGVAGSLAGAVGYVKASNTGAGDYFGSSVALSADGNTLAVGAYREDSNATGIGGDQANDSANNPGAVYVFVRSDGGDWSQQAYVKASNTGAADIFGYAVALSSDGNTLAVGAYLEASNATGIDGDQADDSMDNAGAVYVFVRDTTDQWSQQAYVKASNTGESDHFGWSVALSGDGNTLAVGASGEDSNATGIGGDEADDTAASSGAVYVFVRSDMGVWSQQAYVKAIQHRRGRRLRLQRGAEWGRRHPCRRCLLRRQQRDRHRR
jgi:hypothetical protein